METAQERELLQLQLLGWPFHAVQASLDASTGYTYSGSSISSGGGDSFFLGWEPPFGCFGVVASDAHLHDLFPLCTCEIGSIHTLHVGALFSLQLRPGGEFLVCLTCRLGVAADVAGVVDGGGGGSPDGAPRRSDDARGAGRTPGTTSLCFASSELTAA